MVAVRKGGVVSQFDVSIFFKWKRNGSETALNRVDLGKSANVTLYNKRAVCICSDTQFIPTSSI